ncbi:MAG: DMT family transporter [Elusimicrobiaceae bacterium]|nr:DMT family transporter [Elusimicrobiaceae bacterium]
MFNVLPVCAIWLAWLATSINVVISKLAVPYVTSALFLLFACLIATVCFRFYFGKCGEWEKLFRKDVWPQALAMGTFGTALPMTIFMVALNYTTPVNASIANQFEIIYSLILSAILLKERPTLKQIGGSVLILLGVTLIVLEGGTSLQAKGDLLIIGCLWMYQISHIFAKKLPADLAPQTIAAARAFYAMPALAILCFCLMAIQGPLQFDAHASTLWIVLLVSAVINYFLGNSYWYQAIRHMDLSKATAIILSYPVGTYILSVSFGQDKFTLPKILGMILAVGGAYIVTGIVNGKGANK